MSTDNHNSLVTSFCVKLKYKKGETHDSVSCVDHAQTPREPHKVWDQTPRILDRKPKPRIGLELHGEEVYGKDRCLLDESDENGSKGHRRSVTTDDPSRARLVTGHVPEVGPLPR